MKTPRALAFTLIEVLVASAIAGIVLVAVGAGMVTLRNYVVEEGVVNDATGNLFPLAPTQSQSVGAINLVGALNATISNATWSMTTDQPISLTTSPVSAAIPGLAAAPLGTFSTPASFRTFLASSGIPFSTSNGFSVVFFSTPSNVYGYLNVSWVDTGAYRLYQVGLFPGLSPDSATAATYSFAEPTAYLQTTPAIVPLYRNSRLSGYRVDLPDPSNRYSLNAGRIARTITDPVAQAQAISLLNRGSVISVVIPCAP